MNNAPSPEDFKKEIEAEKERRNEDTDNVKNKCDHYCPFIFNDYNKMKVSRKLLLGLKVIAAIAALVLSIISFLEDKTMERFISLVLPYAMNTSLSIGYSRAKYFIG